VAPAPRLRFGRLWRKLDAQGDSQPAFERLVEAYGETGRAYHTMTHILDCLKKLDEAGPAATGTDAVEAALWFHDVVYDPHRTDNEERSAGWAAQTLGLAGVPSTVVDRIVRLIRTTSHAIPPREPDAALLCDIDLSILGGGPDEFGEYERGIREEYAWVPAPLYRAGRTRVLREFLEREPLYLTPYFHDRYESAARGNLRRALEELTSMRQGADSSDTNPDS
jgi:predicted metal-dependent HD superfamily phosphohydrolase